MSPWQQAIFDVAGPYMDHKGSGKRAKLEQRHCVHFLEVTLDAGRSSAEGGADLTSLGGRDV